MQRLAQQDMQTGDIAVSLSHVTKEFIQWQRSGEFKDIVKNLLRPDKRVIKALNDVSLEIREGEFVAYAGANGAGKVRPSRYCPV